MVSFFLPIKFPSLNDYINVERTNKFAAAKMKKDLTDEVSIISRVYAHTKFLKPVTISFEWYEANQKRDPDNIIFAKKFILDGLVKAGILVNDTQKYILAFDDSWTVDKNKVGVMVSIVEYE